MNPTNDNQNDGTAGVSQAGDIQSNLPGSKTSKGYQMLLVGLLSLNFGILFFDRNALNFLMPFVKEDLGLSNIQVGLTASALSLTWALSGLFFGAMSDRSGRRKIYLIGGTIAFCMCSFLTGMASSFWLLIGARLLMGASEGVVMPVSQSLIVESVSPQRRGVAMGIAQNFGSNILGSFAAPVLLVAIATTVGWRNAFYFAGVPGLVTAALMWWLIREEEQEVLQGAAAKPTFKQTYAEILKSKNMILCAIIAVMLVSYLVICWAFLPLYLTSVRNYEPQTMAWLIGALGISATITSFIVPGISDAIGRKPVMVFVPLIGVILPLAAIFFEGSAWALAAMFFFSWSLVGLFPMFMGTIPSESVNMRSVATAMGFWSGVHNSCPSSIMTILKL